MVTSPRTLNPSLDGWGSDGASETSGQEARSSDKVMTSLLLLCKRNLHGAFVVFIKRFPPLIGFFMSEKWRSALSVLVVSNAEFSAWCIFSTSSSLVLNFSWLWVLSPRFRGKGKLSVRASHLHLRNQRRLSSAGRATDL